MSDYELRVWVLLALIYIHTEVCVVSFKTLKIFVPGARALEEACG